MGSRTLMPMSSKPMDFGIVGLMSLNFTAVPMTPNKSGWKTNLHNFARSVSTPCA